MIVSLLDPYKIKYLIRKNPNPAPSDMMTQHHYVQSGNGHFNAGAQKSRGNSLGVNVTGRSISDYCDIVTEFVKDIGGGFDALGVITFPCQFEQAVP